MPIQGRRLGLLANRLPKREQGRALTYGLVGAFAFRQTIVSDPTFVQEQGSAAARFLLAPGELANYETVVKLIAMTTTAKGLLVTCRLARFIREGADCGGDAS